MKILSNFFKIRNRFQVNLFEKFIIFGVIIIETYNQIIHNLFGFDEKLPFLPLLITSIYCSIFVVYYWIYFLFLIFYSSDKDEKKKK
jgi:alpha-1,3-glucosyltransferase